MKKYNKKFSYSYSFGIYPTLELLEKKRELIINVFFKESAKKSEKAKQILDLCKEYGIKYEFNDKAIDSISVKENTYVLAVFKKYKSEVSNTNHIVLVNPSDSGNLGTIIRTSLGFGVKDIVLIRPAVDIFDPTVVRSSMGAIFDINFEYFDNYQEYIDKYSTNNPYYFVLDKEAKNIKKVTFASPFSLVFGNEGSGLSQETGNDRGTKVVIPHTNNIDSLNLSVAVGISLYEALAE